MIFFSNSLIFMIVMILILVVIYIGQVNCEKFDPNLSQSYQLVNYNSLNQDCNELTWTPTKCTIPTVVPTIKNVCNNELTPITNNQKEHKKSKKEFKNPPNVNLQYNFDLLSSFNNSQINNSQINNLKKNNITGDDILDNNNDPDNKDLSTDIKSLNDLENDLISNY